MVNNNKSFTVLFPIINILIRLGENVNFPRISIGKLSYTYDPVRPNPGAMKLSRILNRRNGFKNFIHMGSQKCGLQGVRLKKIPLSPFNMRIKCVRTCDFSNYICT